MSVQEPEFSHSSWSSRSSLNNKFHEAKEALVFLIEAVRRDHTQSFFSLMDESESSSELDNKSDWHCIGEEPTQLSSPSSDEDEDKDSEWGEDDSWLGKYIESLSQGQEFPPAVFIRPVDWTILSSALTSPWVIGLELRDIELSFMMSIELKYDGISGEHG